MSAFTIASLLANGTAQLADGVEWVREEAAREAENILRGDRDASAYRLMATLLREAVPIIEAQRKEG